MLQRTKLRKNERCPIHHSYWCCGREQGKFERRSKIRPAVERIPDDHHPRGYIEVCSKPEMRRRLMVKLEEQNGICPLCGLPIEDFREAVPDHITPRPAGCKKDDSLDNLQATHWVCNGEKGSKRLPKKVEA